jgi:3-hydroxy-9,10-secoandrosta-1,3,5(10)-triene-9,17-dione monooxygenase
MHSTNIGVLTERAREMSGFVRAHAERHENERRISDEVIARMIESGFFRGFQSKRFQGLESHPADFFGAVIELGKACPSTSWIMGIVGIHQFELANMSLQLQQEVLGDDPDTLISSSYAPQGTALPVEGGHMVSGTWKSSSGVDHAKWIVVGAREKDDRHPTSGPPNLRVCYVPKSEVTVLDDWYVMGLSGTGSKTVDIKEVFVPLHRSRARGGFLGRDPDMELINDAPLYHLPQLLMYILPGAGPVIGAAKGAYELYIEQLKNRRPKLDGTLAKDDPFVQDRLARSKWMVDGAEMRVMRGIDEMMDIVEGGGELTDDQIGRLLMDFSMPGTVCGQAAQLLFETMGASAVYQTNPLQRYLRDILTMRQHGTQDPTRGAHMVAQSELNA